MEDSYKVRKEEKCRSRFKSAWIPDDDIMNRKLPLAPFALNSEEIILADKRAESILVPAGFDWRPRGIFSKTTGMKAHEWKQVVTNGVLKFCLRGMLGQKQRRTLYRLFDVLTKIFAEDVDMNTIDDTEEEVHKSLSLFERDFPVSLQVIVFHLLGQCYNIQKRPNVKTCHVRIKLMFDDDISDDKNKEQNLGRGGGGITQH